MSISIGSDSLFTTTASTVQNNNSSSKLEEVLSSDLDNSSDEELLEVCKSFETYFVEQVFKEMKKTVPDSDSENNEYLSYFGDMLNQKYAENVTEGQGLGIAQMLYESMKR